jgi:DNA ligase (NAD+)
MKPGMKLIRIKTDSHDSHDSHNLSGLNEDAEAFVKKLNTSQLASTVVWLRSEYYNGTSKVSDAKYDFLEDELRKRDPNHTALTNVGADIDVDIVPMDLSTIKVNDPVNHTSNSNHVNITNQLHRQKALLPFWMGSMDKIKPKDNALTNWAKKYTGPYVLSQKLDGLSGLLIYENGVPTKLYTRGDGMYGQDISVLLPYLNLPIITIPTPARSSIVGANTTLAIRGELIMSRAAFKHFADQVPNARNLVSGIINSKTVKLALLQHVEFVTYEIMSPANMSADEQFTTLEALNFKVAWYAQVQIINETMLSKLYAEQKKSSPYEIDGLIVCQNGKQQRNVTGNPKYAFAFKMMVDENEQIAETEVISVEWAHQKDGYMFPRISVKPIFLSGVTISNCSGKNAKFITDNKIGPGAIIKICRGGDVIPDVVSIVKISDDGFGSVPDPDETPYHWSETGVDIILDNPEESVEVEFKRMCLFFSKIGVVGLSEGTIIRCMNAGYASIPFILDMTVADFLKLEGVQDKMANKLYTALQNAIKNLDMLTLMAASNQLGRGIGVRKLQVLLKEIPELLTLSNDSASIAKITKISGFEKKTAEKILVNIPQFKVFYNSLPVAVKAQIVTNSAIGAPVKNATTINSVNSASIPATVKLQRFVNSAVVFTGFRNKELEDVVTSEGGKIMGNVSGNTTLVVIKDSNFVSSKVTFANERGIKVMTAQSFETTYL